MISCLEWIPKGAADPNPKRYEMSKAELAMLQHQADLESKLKEGQELVEDDIDNMNTEKEAENLDSQNNLPADLRMDEYSSDEDDEANVGKLLLGQVRGIKVS